MYAISRIVDGLMEAIDMVSGPILVQRKTGDSTDFGVASQDVSQTPSRIKLLLAHALDEFTIDQHLVRCSELEGGRVQRHGSLVALAPFCAHGGLSDGVRMSYIHAQRRRRQSAHFQSKALSLVQPIQALSKFLSPPAIP